MFCAVSATGKLFYGWICRGEVLEWAWLVQDCFVREREGDIWKRMGNDGKDCLGVVGAVCGYIGREGREIGMWEKV